MHCAQELHTGVRPVTIASMSSLFLMQPSLSAQHRYTDTCARVPARSPQQPTRHICSCTCSTSSKVRPVGARAMSLANKTHCYALLRNGSTVPVAISQSRSRRPVVQPRASSAADAVPDPEGRVQKRSSKKAMVLLGLGTAAAIAAGIALYVSGHASTLQAYLMNGPLGRNGMLAAFCLIFLSELGDKTFFIAALLAMKLGRWISFAGSLAALAVMTLISVGIGAAFSKVPDALKSSLPVGEIAGVALLVFFGIKALKAAKDADTSGTSTSEEELADAEVAVEEFTSSKKLSRKQHFANMFEVATLIFLAEWGDRSMLATIALGAAQNPVGVAVGATAGHALATAIAVAGGALAGKYVDERTVNIVSGCLFLLFAAATVYTMF